MLSHLVSVIRDITLQSDTHLSPQIHSTVRSLPKSFAEYFPDCSEYVVRAGWSPDGAFVWFQLVDRVQRLLKLVFVRWEAFQPEVCEHAQSVLPPNMSDLQFYWICPLLFSRIVYRCPREPYSGNPRRGWLGQGEGTVGHNTPSLCVL